MKVLRFRTLTLLVLAACAQCLLCAGSARAHEGWGIVVDRQGQIYFCDIPTNTIWRIAPGGKPEAFLKDKHSHALALGDDGSIYGTHEHSATAPGSVWRIAPDGSFSNVLTPPPDFPVNLHPFTIDRDGNIYSVNSIGLPHLSDKALLLRAAPDGSVATVAGGARGHRDGRGGDAQFTGIDGMAWAADGSLYVTDGPFVRRVTTDGRVETLGRGPLTTPGYGEDLMGLTVSGGGDLFVADYSGRRLLRLAPGGGVSVVLETGSIWSPTGAVVAGEDLYVLEHLRMPLVLLGDVGVGPYARVRKVSADGRVEKIATVWGRNTAAFAVGLLAAAALLTFALLLRRRRKMRRAYGRNTAQQND